MKTNNWVIYEDDDGIKRKLEFQWIEFSKLSNYHIKPDFLVSIIKKDYNTITTVVGRD